MPIVRSSEACAGGIMNATTPAMVGKMDGWQVLWRRLDTRGIDACRIRPAEAGWAIEGGATFVENGAIASLSYQLLCDPAWKTRSADVHGWIDGRDWRLRVQRGAEGWVMDGSVLAVGAGLLDVDLGFTPASNTNAIRRLALGVGEKAETTALWLDTSDWTLKPLLQTYERVSSTKFAYASPQHGYEAALQVNAFGIVLEYPGLWRAEHVVSPAA